MQHHNNWCFLQKLYSEVVALEYGEKEILRAIDRARWWAECTVWGTIGLQGRQINVSICMVKPVMGNPKVLMALYEELMIIRFCCPCQGSYLDRIWENITVLSCY
jgi:hypothetical protein